MERECPANRFLEFLDILPDAAFAIDRHGRVIAWNRAMAALTGIKAGDMLGEGDHAYAVPFYGIRRPVLIDFALAWDEAAAKSNKYIKRDDGTLVSEVEEVLVNRKLRRLWNTARKLYHESGNCIGAIEITRDITGIMTAAEAQGRYELIKGESRDIILMLDPEDGRILDANPAAVKAYGYNRAEILDMSISDLRTPSDRHLVADQVQKARTSGIMFETIHKRRDGSTFFVEVNSRGAVIGGKPVLISLIRNITERKTAEKALRENAARLSAIFAQAAVGLSEISPQGQFMNVNDELCKLLGRTRKQLLTMKIPDVTHPEDLDHSLAALKQLLEKGVPTSLDKRYVRPDGTIVYSNSSLTRIDDKQGRAQAILAVTVDLTERIKAKEVLERRVAERTAELESRNREIRELAHRTIHAMENDRRILSMELHDSIGGTLAALLFQLQERLELMKSDPPPEVFTFEKILEHLEETIRETRFISKQLRPSILDDFGLSAAIHDTIRDFSDFYPGIGITSHIDIDESDLSDAIQTVIYRVIQEALHNIAKHSQADSAHITLRRADSFVLFQIKDNGIGFDYVKVIGNGLKLTSYGLQSMKERVEICKGTFRLFSEPGKGTQIDVTLPIMAI
jgi:two-component system, NarL family, sensor histidine kinase UhpB